MNSTIPILDIGNLLRSIDQENNSATHAAVVSIAQQLQNAMHHSGFFYIRGFSLNSSMIESLQHMQHAFFSLPEEQKNKSAISTHNRGYLAPGMAKMHGAKEHDQKEVFFWGAELNSNHPQRKNNIPLCGPNLWPEKPAGFRQAVLNYSEQIRTIGNALLRAVAQCLGVKQNFFTEHYVDSLLRGQLICYPQTQGGTDAFGVAPHTDFGCLTFLLQTSAGLEVKTRDGNWIAAPPIADTLVVNIGDLLARWSDDRLPSNRHRVRNTNRAKDTPLPCSTTQIQAP